jgi:hypothetical protein
MERKGSRTNLSAMVNNHPGDQRRNTPSKNANRTSGSSIEVPSPLVHNNDNPFSLLLELVRIIVRKLQDIEQSLSVEGPRKKKWRRSYRNHRKINSISPEATNGLNGDAQN